MADLCDVVEAWLLEGRDDASRAEFFETLYAPVGTVDPEQDLRRLLGV